MSWSAPTRRSRGGRRSSRRRSTVLRTRSPSLEAKYVYGQGEGAETLIIGGGQYGRVELSPEAAEYLERKRCDVVLLPTPDVIAPWNEAEGKVIGLFHVTC